MTRITELRDTRIAAEQIPVEHTGGEAVFQLSFIDKGTGDITFIRFGAEVRDALVGQLHASGLVLARDIPKGH